MRTKQFWLSKNCPEAKFRNRSTRKSLKINRHFIIPFRIRFSYVNSAIFTVTNWDNEKRARSRNSRVENTRDKKDNGNNTLFLFVRRQAMISQFFRQTPLNQQFFLAQLAAPVVSTRPCRFGGATNPDAASAELGCFWSKNRWSSKKRFSDFWYFIPTN